MVQLVEHAPPKQVGWIRFPVGCIEDLKNGTCDLTSLVFAIDG